MATRKKINMKYLKIDASKVGLGTLSIPTKAKFVRKAMVITREAVKAELAIKDNDGSDDGAIKALDEQIKAYDEGIKFIGETARLGAKQLEKLEDAELSEVSELLNDITSQVLAGPGVESSESKS